MIILFISSIVAYKCYEDVNNVFNKIANLTYKSWDFDAERCKNIAILYFTYILIAFSAFHPFEVRRKTMCFSTHVFCNLLSFWYANHIVYPRIYYSHYKTPIMYDVLFLYFMSARCPSNAIRRIKYEEYFKWTTLHNISFLSVSS